MILVTGCEALLNRIWAVVSSHKEIKCQDSGKRAVEATGILCLLDKDLCACCISSPACDYCWTILPIFAVRKSRPRCSIRYMFWWSQKSSKKNAKVEMLLRCWKEVLRNVVPVGKFLQQKLNDEKCCHSDWKIVVIEKGITSEQPESSFRTDIFANFRLLADRA